MIVLAASAGSGYAEIQTGRTSMKKISIAFVVVGVLILSYESATFALEYNRVQNLCRSSHSRIKTPHEAIDALRNYRGGEWGLVGHVLSRVRQLPAFQSDGYSLTRIGDGKVKGGGWDVKEWNESLITRGYTVRFEYSDAEFRPGIEITCDVLECGAIDVSNCLTLGGY
jgi:hypothetical protein